VFRGAFRHRRCLVPASGYYLWVGASGAKTPFAIALKHQSWFCFAGLWDRAWIDGSPVDTFVILTTKPNDAIAGLHHRMPVILDRSDYQAWLDPSYSIVQRLFNPYPADAMKVWCVSEAVGNVRNQGRQLIKEV